MTTAEKYDVVIVGAGAASSVFAALLAEAGKSVLVLESGPARKLTDLYSSQIWARRLKWSTPHVLESGPNRIWFNVNAGRGFGGAAMHHYGIWPRYHVEDFKMKSTYGRALDWPMEYEELRPHYDEVQTDVGMSGDAELEIWRPPGAPGPSTSGGRGGSPSSRARAPANGSKKPTPRPSGTPTTWPASSSDPTRSS